MVGRYANREIYRELFLSRDFLRFLAGVALIPAAFIVKAWFPQVRFFAFLSVPDLLLIGAAAANGAPIIAGAIHGVLCRKINVDELVSVAVAACLVSGEFLEAAVVSAIMVFGSLIEEAVSESARNSIRALVSLSPSTAVIEDPSGSEREVPLSAVTVGDTVLLRPGDTVPVDGSIIQGVTSLDESSLTGESLPVTRRVGDEVSSGTRNLDGFVKLRTLRTPAESTLSRIVALVQAAENSKVGGTKLVDRYALWFTPVILTLAALALIVTRDFNRAVTVLIVGCPCSFLLSGPVPTVAAVARAAREGILVKDGVALETLAQAGRWYFDKTGTLTEGRPRLERIELLTGDQGAFPGNLHAAGSAPAPETLLSLAAAVEQGSEHPLGRAVLSAARERGLPLLPAEGIVVRPGEGILGTVGNREVRVGRLDIPQVESDATVVEVSVDGRAVGRLSFRDIPREESVGAIAALRRQGVGHLAMISGDQAGPVRSVAAALSMDAHHHRLTPAEKLSRLQNERSLGTVVYVGDGLNDAPALRAADVGIAMGERGVDAALDTADIVLLNDRIGSLPFLHRLSRRMRNTIKANIALSFSINALSVAAAFFGLLTPVLGALTHNVGSVLVVALSASLGLMKDRA